MQLDKLKTHRRAVKDILHATTTAVNLCTLEEGLYSCGENVRNNIERLHLKNDIYETSIILLSDKISLTIVFLFLLPILILLKQVPVSLNGILDDHYYSNGLLVAGTWADRIQASGTCLPLPSWNGARLLVSWSAMRVWRWFTAATSLCDDLCACRPSHSTCHDRRLCLCCCRTGCLE